MTTPAISRRSILAAGSLATVGLMTDMSADTAAAANPKIKVYVCPHPDDEVLRAGSEINWAVRNGWTVVLLALTDGGATSMGRREGLNRAAVEERRRSEQIGAWNALTYGQGHMIRANLPDGAVTYRDSLAAIRSAMAAYPGAEVFSLAHPLDDGSSSDHIPVWQAVRDCGARIIRYFKRPDQGGGYTGINYPEDKRAVEDALRAYWWTLGPRSSVAYLRDALIAQNFRSRYTRG